MVFDGLNLKSPVQEAVEAILAQSATRFDARVRRERTIAAMLLECAERGYAETKVVQVAKRAKVSTASVYRDFVDRDHLLMAAIETIIPLFARNWLPVLDEIDPVARIEALLLAHGRALADPFMGWIFRLYVHVAHTKEPRLLSLARLARDSNLNHWSEEIGRLEDAGLLGPHDRMLTIGILLGAIERRTIFARMAFGENDDNPPDFSSVATHAANALFYVHGSAEFWANRENKPERFRAGIISDNQTLSLPLVPQPNTLMELPSLRLSKFASHLFSQDVARLDVVARRTRVQVAAMMECIEHGYEAATMASVATRAGVSTATLYLDYQDKSALFLDAIVLQSRFRVDYRGLLNDDDAIEASIVSLVYSISYVLADPHFLWFHRISMASEISNSPELIASSRQTRAHTEAFWRDYLTKLQQSQQIVECDLPLIINLLLGATQRRSVLSMVFFGIDDVSKEDIARYAVASTEFVLKLIANPTKKATL
jgi:AcrR family transcriptional regulator